MLAITNSLLQHGGKLAMLTMLFPLNFHIVIRYVKVLISAKNDSILPAPDSGDMMPGLASTKVAREILNLGKEDDRPLTPLELIKLTYIAHGWSLGLNEKPLVSENAEAWQYGPVFPGLYHALKRYKANPVEEVPVGEEEYFVEEPTEDDMKIIRSVYKSYKKYNGIQLSTLTHQPGTPWDRTWKKSQGSIIKNKVIKEHFAALAEKRNVRRKVQ